MAIEIAEKNAETLKEGTTGDNLPKQSIHGVSRLTRRACQLSLLCAIGVARSPTRKQSVTSVGNWDTSRKCADNGQSKLLNHPQVSRARRKA